MTLGEFLAVIGSYPGKENIMRLPLMVHTPDSGEGMVDAEVYLLTNEKTGEKCLHLDAAQQSLEQVQQ